MSESTKCVTPEFRVSYAFIWEPRRDEDDPEAKPKFGMSCIFDKETADMDEIEECIQAAIRKKWGNKPPKNLRFPIRDGDKDRDEEAYQGAVFFSANSFNQPQVIKRVKGKNVPIMDEEEFYSGCYAVASVNFYAFDRKDGKGIACGLNNILKTRDGERLDGRTNADQDFADVDLDNTEGAEEDDPLAG